MCHSKELERVQPASNNASNLALVNLLGKKKVREIRSRSASVLACSTSEPQSSENRPSAFFRVFSFSFPLYNYIEKSIISAKIFWLRVCSVCHQSGAFGVSIG